MPLMNSYSGMLLTLMFLTVVVQAATETKSYRGTSSSCQSACLDAKDGLRREIKNSCAFNYIVYQVTFSECTSSGDYDIECFATARFECD